MQTKQNFHVVIVLPVFPAGDLKTAATKYLIKNVNQFVLQYSRCF